MTINQIETETDENSRCGHFRDYCNSSSIHGIKYLGEKHRSVVERVWWMAVFTTCLYFCVVMILKVYNKWETSPVIVTFSTKETPIYEIPFPAVTICPEIKATRDRDELNFTRLLHKKLDERLMSPNETVYFEYLSLICNLSPEVDYSTFNETLPTTFFDVLDEIKSDFLQMSIGCEWMGNSVDCADIFVPIITDEGVCYTFNMLDRDDLFRNVVHYGNYHHKVDQPSSSWSYEDGYGEMADEDAYPRRALLAGATNSLKIFMFSRKMDLDFACSSLQGYKVLFHTPARFPRLSQEYLRISHDESLLASIQPTMIKTSKAVKNYDPKKRECSLPSERHLRFFKIYSQLNCELECLANFTKKYCGCVSFFMPHDNETLLCGVGSFECVKDAESEMNNLGLQSKFNISANAARSRKTDCNCLPLCTDVSYNTHISQTEWNWSERLKALRFDRDFDVKSYHASSLFVFFKFNHFITSERNELFGPTDFLAHFGGLLGLFTGFSILSVIEIVYFLTLRPLCNALSRS